MQPWKTSESSPHITIYADSGPLAGDLAACLSGHFEINQVNSPKGALLALSRGCQALLILQGAQGELGVVHSDLVKQAIAERCRVVVLGSGGLGLGSDLNQKIVQLPHLPSPQLLFDALAGLDSSLEAGAS